MADTKEPVITIDDLPITFQVKYLGSHPSKGLWGIKHTRKPVDVLVQAAKNLGPDKILPFVVLEVSKDGVTLKPLSSKDDKNRGTSFSIDTISYGVQDLVYTRVFCMIVVEDVNIKEGVPFTCHGFVCDSRNQTRKVTYALAAAFQDYGRRVKEENASNPDVPKKRFAIDLRTPEEQQQESDGETEA